MEKQTTTPPPAKENGEGKVKPDQQGVDKAPGEETGKNEPVTKEDLTGKQKVDEAPGDAEKRP